MRYFFNSIMLLFLLTYLGACKKSEVIPVSPDIVFYPNPFIDIVNISFQTNSDYKIAFLGKDSRIIEQSSGKGNLFTTFSFKGVKDEVILAEVEVDNIKYVYQLYKSKSK